MKAKKLLLTSVLGVMSVCTLVGCGGGEKPQELVDRVAAEVNYAGLAKGINMNQELTTEVEGVKITYAVTDLPSTKYIKISADNANLEVTAPTVGDKLGDVTVDKNWFAACKFSATFEYKGATKTRDFGVKIIAKAKVMNHAEFIAAAPKDEVLVHITIDKVIPSMKNGTSLVWGHDDAGDSYYLYQVDKKYIDAEKVAEGNKVAINGKKDIYNGLHQIKSVSNVALINKGGQAKAQKDISADLTAKAMTDKALIDYIGAPVKATNIVLNELPEINEPKDGVYDKIHLHCMVKDTDKAINLVVARGGEDAKAINDLVKTLAVNDVLTVEGWGEWYNGFSITLVPDSVITKTGTVTKTDQQKVDESKEVIEAALPTEVLEGFTLPAAKYDDVAVAWESSDAAIAITENTAKVTPAEQAKEVTLTATLTKGDKSAKVTKVVKVGTTAEAASTIKVVRLRADGADAVVKGQVTAVQGTSFYIDDGVSSIFIYNIKNHGLSVGDEATITGEKSSFNGLTQVKNGAVEKITEETFTPREVLTVTPETFNSTTLAGEDGRIAFLDGIDFSKAVEESVFDATKKDGRFAFTFGEGDSAVKVKFTINKFATNGQAIVNAIKNATPDAQYGVQAPLGWYKGPQFDLTDAAQIILGD